MEVTSTEAQNNFGQYIKFAQFEDIIVSKNGKKIVVISAYQDPEDKRYRVAETAEEYMAEKQRITYEEFLQLSEGSENRYEYIDGEVYLLASPTYDHQSIIMEIINIMHNWFKGKKCKVLTSPFDVTLIKNEDKNVVQPDVIVICDKENVNKKGRYMGVPTLVVEVLSESTRRKDILKKTDLYMQSGIHEYWVVSPFNHEISVYYFEDKDITDHRTYKGKDILESFHFEGLRIPLEQVFET